MEMANEREAPPDQIVIGPGCTLADVPRQVTVDWKIGLFEARVRGWQIEQAREVVKMTDAGFAALSIIMSYFEVIARHEAGDVGIRDVEAFFRRGVLAVFPELERRHGASAAHAIADMLYHQVRCGMYHDGITGGGTAISGQFEFPLEAQSRRTAVDATKGQEHWRVERVYINPAKLIESVAAHFDSYIARLRDTANGELRANFDGRFQA